MYAWVALLIPELLCDPHANALEIFVAILVVKSIHATQRWEKRRLKPEMFQVRRMLGKLWIKLGVDADTGLICPRFRYVTRSITASTDNDELPVEFLDKCDAITMSLHIEIEHSEAIAAERVCTALEYYGRRIILVDTITDDTLEQGHILVVFDPIMQWYIQSMMSPWATVIFRAGVGHPTGPWEEFCGAEFVKR